MDDSEEFRQKRKRGPFHVTSLEVYLWFHVVAGAIGALARAIFLGIDSYPRQSKWTRGEEFIALLSSVIFIVWGIYLIKEYA